MRDHVKLTATFFARARENDRPPLPAKASNSKGSLRNLLFVFSLDVFEP